MSKKMVSERQRTLFEALAEAGDLILATGPRGVSANIVGPFRVTSRRDGAEDRLDMGDGTQHVHLDWTRVKRAEVDLWGSEGRLKFYDGEESLFTLYRFDGPYSAAVHEAAGALV